jgi:hypothetical protein
MVMRQTLNVTTTSGRSAVALARKLAEDVSITRDEEGFHIAIPLTLETHLNLGELIDEWAADQAHEPVVRLIG